VLKNRKSAGTDGVINEMIKTAREEILPILTRLFNLIYSTGIFPESWAISMIKPLFKGGNPFDPSDYRGISLTSCLGKLFCAILNTRLVTYLEENNIYTPHQIAFRKKFRTSDHIFVLHTLINKYTSAKFRGSKGPKNLYVCFVDLKKAFDTVWRGGLFHKLLENGIGGKLYNIITNMYSKSKASVKLSGGITEYFETTIGVKQGCVISPTLFNIFLNDIPTIFDHDKSFPVTLYSELLNCLLYADDIALVSSTEEGLQYCIDKLNSYCKTWNLTINIKKTKVIIFNTSGRIIKNEGFKVGNEILEVVKETKYLGIVFNSNCTYHTAIENLKNKSTKAMFKLFKSFGNTTPNIKTSIHLFNAMIKPILLYNCEIWGPTICDLDKLLEINVGKSQLYYKYPHEKLHMKWAKYILGVNSKSTNIAVTAEIGQYPLMIDIICTTVKYWARMSEIRTDSLLHDCYKSNIQSARNGEKCWISFIENIANKTDFHSELNTKKAVKKTRLYLENTFEQQFHKDLYNDTRSHDEGNKLRTYRTFKDSIIQEEYLTEIKNRKIRQNITKLRISAHNLKIETGRHTRPKTILENRTCDFCPDKIDNEFHLISQCERYSSYRNTLFLKANEKVPGFQQMNDTEKFIYLLRVDDPNIKRDFVKFIKEIVNERGNL
jgi:hypothetical protein